MADNALAILTDEREITVKSVAATSSTDFSSETISPEGDCVIRSIYWAKPADCDLTITLLSDVSGSPAGASVVLVSEDGADGNTSGAASAGRPLRRYNSSTGGGRLQIDTTKTTAGTVTITVYASPAHVGV